MDVEKKQKLRGLVMDCASYLEEMSDRHKLAVRLLEYVRDVAAQKPMIARNGGNFLVNLLRLGPKFPPQVLRDLEFRVQASSLERGRSDLLSVLDEQIRESDEIVGRWRTEVSVLGWMQWSSKSIADALTLLCFPFYSLRAHEFSGKGPNVESLSTSYKAVSQHVLVSSLHAFLESIERGREVLKKWLEVAELLRRAHNYHMLMAVQNGLMRHQLDRLGVWKLLSSSVRKRKLAIDELFAVEDRMAKLIEEQKEAASRRVEGMIPCIFWLAQKAELLQETPRYHDGRINEDRLLAADNVFGALLGMQSLRYPSLAANEAFFYMRHLDRQPLKEDEELYVLSDKVKESVMSVKARSSSFGDMFRRSSSSTPSLEASLDSEM